MNHVVRRPPTEENPTCGITIERQIDMNQEKKEETVSKDTDLPCEELLIQSSEDSLAEAAPLQLAKNI